MKTELLCCCLGAFLWALGATFAWALCAVGGMADERRGYDAFHVQNEGVGFGPPDDEWLPGEVARIVGYEDNVPLVKFRDERMGYK